MPSLPSGRHSSHQDFLVKRISNFFFCFTKKTVDGRLAKRNNEATSGCSPPYKLVRPTFDTPYHSPPCRALLSLDFFFSFLGLVKPEYFFFFVIRFFLKILLETCAFCYAEVHTPIFLKVNVRIFLEDCALTYTTYPFFGSAVDLKENPRVVFNPTFIKKIFIYKSSLSRS